MEEEEEGSGVYRPTLEIEHSSEMDLQQVEELPDTQQCEVVTEMDDSQLVGASTEVADEAAMVGEEALPNDSQLVGVSTGFDEEAALVGEEATPTVEVEMDTEAEVAETSRGGGGKRKRGRQPRVQAKPPSKKKEEEDVCFICFDGGNLVLCDRRGCPKAYHPACVNRDEAFFRSKGRWNCGWHICSNCERAAQYMCYTCTYSLCKGCIKEAEFVCVRGNKGFCGTCMRTVLLIENNEQGNKEMAQVDFDDKSSWEYLFKDYWIDLKGKLSLTLDELTQARNPWKGSGDLAPKGESSDEVYDANDDRGSSSDSALGDLEASKSKKRKAKKRSKSTKMMDSPSVAEAFDDGGTPMVDNIEWASNELLEFVSNMKNGDKSVLSQFDVQALLLEYIKRNNLRDPRRKSQIICDSRLENLFGKARVGHFEMLKLLEAHFFIKEDTQADDIQGGIIDTEGSQLETDENNDTLTKAGKDKRRKTRKKGDEKEPQTNLDDYAAIDVHNITLIYLRRNLMEELLADANTLQDKVVGTFVRIRISGSGQKQDMYRLVQVVGIRKVPESYKTGKRTTDIMLEILNLNKTETISIDTISNQEFSEDECKRLRQSIKCGLISPLTVGEVQEKAMAVQAVRVNDWLEAEILRLSHLRDRASEKGRRKELRECVEKLQLLNTPEERLRRLQEIPEVHADPNMDPSYESDDDEGEPDDKRRDNYMRPRDARHSRKGREPISPGRGGLASNDNWNGARKNSTTNWVSGRYSSTRSPSDKGDDSSGAVGRTNESTWTQGRDAHQSNSWEKAKNRVAATGLDTGAWSSQAAVKSDSSSGLAPEPAAAPLSTGVAQSSNISETDKMWHYQDPSGKIQGPFSMVQLRKWSTTGYFPTDLKIWRATEKQDESILLTDALIGKFQKEPPRWDNSYSQPQKAIAVSDNREGNWGGGWRGNNSSTWSEKKQGDGSRNTSWKESSAHVNGTVEYAKRDGWASRSSGWTATEAVNPKEGQSGSSSGNWDSSKANNAWSGQPQVHSPRPSASFSGKPYRTPSHHGREGQGGERWTSGQSHGTWNSNRPTGFQSNSAHGHEKRSSNRGQPSVENWRSQPENSTSKGWATPSSVETPKSVIEGWGSSQGSKNDSSNLLSPTPKASSIGWTGDQVSENKWSATPAVPVHLANSGWDSNPSPGGNVVQPSPAAVSEPRKTASGWGEQHHISVTPSLGGWDSKSGSASMPKPSETLDPGGQLDFSCPPTPTPTHSSGNLIGSQSAVSKWDATSTLPGQQTNPYSGGAPNQLVAGAQQLSASMKEHVSVAAEWGGQSPTPEKPSLGEWELDAVSSVLKSTGTTNCQESTSIPESGRVTDSSSLLPASVRPTEGLDRCSSTLEISASGSHESSCLANQSGSSLPSKNDCVTSLGDLALPTSAEKGGGYLIRGSGNDCSSSLHGSSPTPEQGKGSVLSSADDRQIPSQSTSEDNSHKVAQTDVLDSQNKFGAYSSQGVQLDGDAGPSDVSANVGMEKTQMPNTQTDPPAPDSASCLMNTGADSQPNRSLPSKTADSSVPNLVLSVDSLKPLDETNGRASDSAQKPEIVGSRVGVSFESPDWGAALAQKQEPPISIPMAEFAAQKPGQPTYSHWGGGPLSANSLAAYGTADGAGNHPTPGISVPDSMPSGNSMGPLPAIQSSNWPIPSAAAPTKPSSWDGGPGAVHGSTQNNSFAPSAPQNIQPSVPSNRSWSTGATENIPSAGRPTPENSNSDWGQAQGNANMGWGGSAQGSTNTGWGAGQGSTVQGNANMGWSPTGSSPAGNPGMWASQQKHNGERFSGQGDRSFQGGDFGQGGGGRPWNRQSSFGGGSSRLPPKGQRVCKFHESGHCKKGAECDYLHT